MLNIVFAAPAGERLDTPERKAAIEGAIAKLETSEFKPTEDDAGVESVGDPFSKDTFSDNGRIGATAVGNSPAEADRLLARLQSAHEEETRRALEPRALPDWPAAAADRRAAP